MASKKLFYKSRMLVVIPGISNNLLTPWKQKNDEALCWVKTSEAFTSSRLFWLILSRAIENAVTSEKWRTSFIRGGRGKGKTSNQAFLPRLNYSAGEGLLLPPLVLLPQPDSKSLTVVVGNVFKSPESFILLMMGCPCVTDIFSEGVKWWQLCLILKMKWSFEVYERRRESSLSVWLLWFLKSVCNPSKSFHKHFESFQENLFYFVLVCLFGFLLGFPSLRGITQNSIKGGTL